MKGIIKKRLLFFLKIIISFVIFYFIFKKINLTQVWFSFRKIDAAVFIFLLILTMLKIIIEFLNWRNFLTINPQYIPRKGEIWQSLFIGYALRFLVPGGYGIVGKMYFVNNKKSATFVSLTIEKFYQIWLLLFFAAFSSIFYFGKIVLFWKLLFFIFILLLPYLPSHLHLFFKNEILSEYFKNYRSLILITILRKIVYMLLTILQYFLILQQFFGISFWKVFISVPLVLVSNIIPITYSGLGLRESFAMEIFPKFGISGEIAVTTTLTIFLFNSVLPAIVGLYFIVSHKKSG